MQATHAGVYPSGQSVSFIDRLNGEWHEVALRAFMVIVLAHWAEHLTQAFQIYALGWPVPEARGVLGQFYPWLVKSETLHYGYAVVMLVCLFALRKGFTDVLERRWWTIALVDPVLPPHRTWTPADPGPHRAQLLRPSRADEHRPALGPACGTAPLLQHDRLHSDGDRDVLPHVSGRACRGAEVHVRLAPGVARCRLTPAPGHGVPRRFFTFLMIGGLAGAACSRPVAPADDVVVEWKTTPPVPLVDGETLVEVTLLDKARRPLRGAALRVEALHDSSRDGAGRRIGRGAGRWCLRCPPAPVDGRRVDSVGEGRAGGPSTDRSARGGDDRAGSDPGLTRV